MISVISPLTWLLATVGSTFVVANEIPQIPLTPESINATLLGGSGIDQIRFLQCVKDDPKTFGRMVAYYDHPPQGSEKPTQVALKQFDSVPWGKGCNKSGKSSDGAGWSCDIDEYVWSEDIFKASVGSVTYGYTGFNCFVDDGHGAHYEGGDYGMCYCELYCTYQHAMPLAVDASSETVKVQYRATAIDGKEPHGLPTEDARGQVKGILTKAKTKVGDQQCKPSLVQLTPECTMSVSCTGGEPEYLQKLMDALITIYDTDKNLFKGIDEKDCTPRQPICDPATGRCREQPDICEYTKGVEMPRRYVLSMVDRAPPNSGVNSPILGGLTVDIQCEYHQNDVMCDAMSKLLSGLGLYGPISKIFKIGGIGVKAGCNT